MNGVLGVCGTGIVSCVGGTSALKAEIPDTKETDTGSTLSSVGSFSSRSAGNLSSRGSNKHRNRLCLMCGRDCVVIVLLQTRRRQQNRIFPRGILNSRIVSGSGLLMISSLFMATISLTVYGPLLMYIIFGAEPLIAGYIIALESLGWTIVAISTVRCQRAR